MSDAALAITSLSLYSGSVHAAVKAICMVRCKKAIPAAHPWGYLATGATKPLAPGRTYEGLCRLIENVLFHFMVMVATNRIA